MKKAHIFMLLCIPLLLFGLGYCATYKHAPITPSISLDALRGKKNIMPIAVIGSGPAGLMASVYGARGGKPTYVIEGNEPGGLLMQTTDVANWPGETMVQGPDIIKKLRTQADHHNVTFVSDHVAKIDTNRWPYAVNLESGTTMYALTIILASGASPRRLDVPGEDVYWGAGVTSCAICDAPFFKGEEVVVVGGGDSAVEEAIQLAPFAKHITILVRKGQMRAAQSMQNRLHEYPNIDVKYHVEVKEVIGDIENVTSVQLYNNKENTTEKFKTAGVFLAIGHIPNSHFAQNAIQIDKEGYVKLKNGTHTSQSGIYAAGDIADKRYRQAGTSAGTGIQAALDAVQFLDNIGFTHHVAQATRCQLFYPGQKYKPDHSITLSSCSDLEAYTASYPDQFMVLDFSTETCSACKQMEPAFKEAAAYYSDSAIFASVDADEASDIADRYNVVKVPTLIILKNGKVQERHTGFLGRQELYSFLENQLSEG